MQEETLFKWNWGAHETHQGTKKTTFFSAKHKRRWECMPWRDPRVKRRRDAGKEMRINVWCCPCCAILGYSQNHSQWDEKVRDRIITIERKKNQREREREREIFILVGLDSSLWGDDFLVSSQESWQESPGSLTDQRPKRERTEKGNCRERKRISWRRITFLWRRSHIHRECSIREANTSA